MSVWFAFPGQGAQRPGMLHRLPADREIERTLREAGDLLGRDPLGLDSTEALGATGAVQLCLLIAGVAMARLLIARGAEPDMVAGLSIGAFPAAVIAGSLEFSDAVPLVARRGQLMAQAFPTGYGMAAISGLDRGQVMKLLAAVHGEATPVYLANLNAERQMVIAGSDQALAAVLNRARTEGASRAERLAVGVPSHCPLLEPAAHEMALALADIRLRPPVRTYLSGSSARAIHDPARIADDLAHNLARQVHWQDTTRQAWERGARLAVEMPCGNVLTGLHAEVFADGVALSCENTGTDTLVALVQREAGRNA